MKKIGFENFREIAFGAAVGLASSLFGGGGGMLAVPLLEKMGLKTQEAHATAILLILPVSMLAFILYAFRGYADFNALIPTAIGVTAGGFLGAVLLQKLPEKKVALIFAALQAFAGFWLIFF